MGNPLEVYGSNYKVKKVKNLSFGKIWPPSDWLFLEWSYCSYGSLTYFKSDWNHVNWKVDLLSKYNKTMCVVPVLYNKTMFLANNY